MKKKFYSFVSMFLVICMVMSSIPVYAITEPESKLDTLETNAENKETITNPEFNAASSSKVLDYVDRAEFESHKFIGRVTEEEELNSYVFQNEDGSRTAYFFSENVKYVDKDGIVQEKDISLVATRDGYKTTKNEVSVNFSSSPSNGITMGYGEHTVTLKPIFTTKGVMATRKDNAIEYEGLFDSNTTLKYTPLLSGIKEDIVLTKYTGVNEYSFTLTTNGLGIYESANGYFLAESKATKAIFYLGDIIAYDANYVPYEGTLTVKTIKENQEYTLTVSVDEEFLTDENTVYPVIIDPTITISDTASGAGAIQDAPIFSARPSSNHGTYEYDRVGTPSADFGIGRTVVRLYGLINSSIYKNTKLTDITSVKFFAKEATGSATQYINLYPLQNTGWTESGVTWNNIGVCYNTSNYGASMAYAQLTEFDITNLVIAWKTETYSANAGFIMMSSNESANKCFVSSEHSDTSRRPYVVMAYEKSIDFDNAITLQLDVFKTTTISQSGEVKCYKFIPTETGFYTFQSSSSSGDPKGWLYNTLEQEITSNDDISSSNRNFRITYHLVSGKTYYFLAGYYLSGTGSYNIQLRRTDNDSYLKTTTISFGSAPEVYNISLESQIYKFTPTVSCLYVFYSNGNSDPKAWIYDSDLSCMGYDDDSAGNSSFRLAYNLTAGNTYYIVAGQFGSENGSYVFRCLREINVPGGSCFIRNTKSQLYIDIENLNNQEWLSQNNKKVGYEEQWRFSRKTDGYYSIQSEYGDRKFIGINSSSTTVDTIKLYSSNSDSTSWGIFENPSGKIVFIPKSAAGRVLISQDTVAGSRLRLGYLYNIDSSDKNFWEVDSYELSLELYYDNAFDVRYSNCTEIIDYLTDETIGLLHETFGLKIAAEEPVMIISTADRCKIERGLPINLSTIDGNYSICLANLFVNGTCPNCNTHNATSNNCTSWKKMFDDFYQEHPGNQTTKIVLFTGNRLYDDHGILCNRSFIRNKTVITLQEIQQTRAVYKNKMLSCLLHEMSHAIGAPDHYHDVIENDDGTMVCANEALCVECNEEFGRPVWCSMGDDGTWRTDLLTCDIEDIYCTGCLNDIWEYLEEHQ